MKRVGFVLLLASITMSAQNAPLALYQYPELAKRYEDALQKHPEKLGGKVENSPVFVGGQSYSYSHCVQLANWVIDNLSLLSSLSVIQLGNLQYALDGSCNAAYDFYRCPESRRPDSIPASPQQYAGDCANVGAAIAAATSDYHKRLDQAFAALPLAQRQQMEAVLTKDGRELPADAFSLWLPDEFKPSGKEEHSTVEVSHSAAQFPQSVICQFERIAIAEVDSSGQIATSGESDKGELVISNLNSDAPVGTGNIGTVKLRVLGKSSDTIWLAHIEAGELAGVITLFFKTRILMYTKHETLHTVNGDMPFGMVEIGRFRALK